MTIIDIETIRATAYQAASAAAASKVREMEAYIDERETYIASLERQLSEASKDQSANVSSIESNVVALNAPDPYDDPDDEYVDGIQTEADAISSFCGGISCIGDLTFRPQKFWENTGKTGSHSEHIYQRLLAVNAIAARLIQEFAKKG